MSAASTPPSAEDRQRYLRILGVDSENADLAKARFEATRDALKEHAADGPKLAEALADIREAFDVLTGREPRARQPRPEPESTVEDDDPFAWDADEDPFGGGVNFDEGGKQDAKTADTSAPREAEQPDVFGPTIGENPPRDGVYDPFAFMRSGLGSSQANTRVRLKPFVDLSASRPPRYEPDVFLKTVATVARTIADQDLAGVLSLAPQYLNPATRHQALRALHNEREHTIGPALCGESGENYAYALEAVLTKIFADAAQLGYLPRFSDGGNKFLQLRREEIPYGQIAARALDAFAVAEGLPPRAQMEIAKPEEIGLA